MTRTNEIFSLHDLYQSDAFDAYRGDKLGNNLFINDPDRADRIHEAAESGSDGSTHREIIKDWRDFLGTLDDMTDDTRESIEAEIAGCERWHEQQGTLDEQMA